MQSFVDIHGQKRGYEDPDNRYLDGHPETAVRRYRKIGDGFFPAFIKRVLIDHLFQDEVAIPHDQ